MLRLNIILEMQLKDNDHEARPKSKKHSCYPRIMPPPGAEGDQIVSTDLPSQTNFSLRCATAAHGCHGVNINCPPLQKSCADVA